ncbi:MAG: L,D-transpeptidase family protein [Gammaproteobacteria bacterium]|nr:L,D-transpeptidase family protein [Gammaproteobacteria bacterium]
MRVKHGGLAAAFLVALAVATVLAVGTWGRSFWVPAYRTVVGDRTVADVMAEYGEPATKRLAARFEAAGLHYPPSEVALVGLKSEMRLELWAPEGGAWRHVADYAVTAASGVAGPKLREGDRQVPEGLYRIVGLNANSRYHLSMKLDYPNAFDRRHAARDGRAHPGSDIFIHGKAVSVGCLAVGDAAVEELFVLAASIGKDNVAVVVAPFDGRQTSLLPPPEGLPPWTPELYRLIGEALARYSRPRSA